MTALLVGIDVGTSACKAAVVDEDGRELAHGKAPTPWRQVPTGAEADPEALFGFPPGAFGPEQRIHRVLHPDDRERVEDCLSQAIESGMYDCEYRVVRPDGRTVWLTERGRVVHHGAEDRRMVGITRDVTVERESARERDELLRRAREARDDAERQVRLKDDFLSVVAHDVRTPLTTILINSELLQNALDGDGRNGQRAGALRAEAERLRAQAWDLSSAA